MKGLLCALVACWSGVAWANPLFEVVSAFEKKPADRGSRVRGDVTYELELSKGDLRREHAGFAGSGEPLGAIPERSDLTYSILRHVISPTLEVGLFRGLSFGVRLPIIVRQRSTLNVVDRTRTMSSTIRDNILPQVGFDSQKMGAPTDPADRVLFRSPDRAGLDVVHLALTYAISDARKEPWLPTWKISAGFELSIGQLMKMDSQNPTSSSGVSRGVHALTVSTSLAKKFEPFLPFVEISFRAPLSVRSGAPLDKPQLAGEAPDVNPPMEFSGRGGLEWWMWDAPARGHRFIVTAEGGLKVVTSGRDYSPLWEAFALAGDPARNGPLVLDRDPLTPEIEPLAYGGPSNVAGHIRSRVAVSLSFTYAKRVELALGGEFGFQQAHLVSTAEQTLVQNPLHVPLIDQVGRRYRLADALDFIGSFRAAVSF